MSADLAESLGGVVFDKKIWIEESEKISQAVVQERYPTIDGGEIVYEIEKKNSQKSFTLSTRNETYISEQTKDAIQALADNSKGATYSLAGVGGGEIGECTFDHTKGAVNFTRVTNISQAKYYYAEIYLKGV
jgi:hypothetical protein